MKIVLILLSIFVSDAFAHSVIGVLRGKREILIKTKSQGELRKINFLEGSMVKAGDIIAEIESEKEQLELKIALNDFKQAKSDFEKSKKLKQYLSEDELLKKKNDYLKKENLYKLKKYNLDNKNISTPIDGIIAKNYIKEGENIPNGAKAFEVIQYDELVIDLYIHAKYIEKFKEGDFLKFYQEIDKKTSHMGEIFFVSPVLDKSSGTVHLKLKIRNKKDKNGRLLLKPGAMVKVTVE